MQQLLVLPLQHLLDSDTSRRATWQSPRAEGEKSSKERVVARLSLPFRMAFSTRRGCGSPQSLLPSAESTAVVSLMPQIQPWGGHKGAAVGTWSLLGSSAGEQGKLQWELSYWKVTLAKPSKPI